MEKNGIRLGMTYAERITGGRATPSAASPTIETLNTYLCEQVGTLLLELPEIEGMHFTTAGLHSQKEERASYNEMFTEKAPEQLFAFVASKILGVLSTTANAIKDNPGYFSAEFHENACALQQPIEAAILQSNDAISRGFMPALQQIHEKETKPAKGHGAYMHHRGRLDGKAFAKGQAHYVQPLYALLDTLESQIKALPTHQSRDTAFANYLTDTTHLAKNVLEEATRIIDENLEAKHTAPSR